MPWITVDLGAVSTVFSVTLWNRGDCCQNRLLSFSIFAGNQPLPVAGTLAIASTLSYNPVCASGVPPASWLSGATPSFTVICAATARYITLQRTDGNAIINLCQIEVDGLPGPPQPSPPPSPPAPSYVNYNLAYNAVWAASSVYNSNAFNDPDAALRFQSVSQITTYATQCALSNTSFQVFSTDFSANDTMPYVTIDLGAAYNISSLTIFNRADCCQDRFSQFQILVRAPPRTSPNSQASCGLPAKPRSVAPRVMRLNEVIVLASPLAGRQHAAAAHQRLARALGYL